MIVLASLDYMYQLVRSARLVRFYHQHARETEARFYSISMHGKLREGSARETEGRFYSTSLHGKLREECIETIINIVNDDVDVSGPASLVDHEPLQILDGGNGWEPVSGPPGSIHNISIDINTDGNDAMIDSVFFNLEGISNVEVILMKDGFVVLPTEFDIGVDDNVVTINFNNRVGDEIVLRITEDLDDTTQPRVENFEAKACYHPLATTTVFVTLTSGVSTPVMTTAVIGSTTPSVWSEWSPWSDCSETCGLGVQTRLRDCEPGNVCEGVAEETMPCNLQDCPTTPAWTAWTPWSDCDVFCGEGAQYRFRECNDPPPMPGQIGCLGEPSESMTCTEPACTCQFDMDSFVEEFGYEPSEIVGWMEKDGIPGPSSDDELVRAGDNVADDAVINVECNECICEGGSFNCNKTTCEECTYTQWSDWTPCSKSCDVGQQNRSRTLLSGQNIQTCTEPRTETLDCNAELCPIPENWSPWSEWSNCSSTEPCTAGIMIRDRECLSDPSAPCTGDPAEIEVCAEECAEPIECTKGKVWVNCSTTCPQTCRDYRLNGYCTEPENCVPGCKCPDGFVASLDGTCVQQDTCPCYTPDGVEVWVDFPYTEADKPCESCKCSANHTLVCEPIEDCCDWKEWTPWGACDVTCGQGTRNRYRNQTTDANCGSNMETEDCFLDSCPPGCVVNGSEYEWGELISDNFCEKCYCTVEVNYYCVNDTMSVVDGEWAAWSVWSQCSSTCQGGSVTRTRTCSDPLPKCGGEACPGNNFEDMPCNVNISCCETTPFSQWGDCDQECGDGNKTRSRNYVDPAQDSFCNELLEESQPCNYGECNMTCVLSEWSDWTPCSVTCGLGTLSRDRDIVTSAPDCPTEFLEVESCYSGDCPCLTNQVWSNNSLCQQTCDERTGGVNVTACSEPSEGCVCEDSLYLDANDNCVNNTECDKCYGSDGLEVPAGSYDKEDDSCYQCECVQGHEECNRKCPLPVCAENEELSYDDAANPCCPICKQIPDTCQMYSKTEFLSDPSLQCVSVNEITVNYCAGSCGNSTSGSVLMLEANADKQQANCRCCTGVVSASLTEVDVICGGVERKAYVAQITECKCNGCLSTESPPVRR